MTNYKFEQKIIRIRYVDYLRIRHVFPAMREESMQSYFRRLALWLKAEVPNINLKLRYKELGK